MGLGKSGKNGRGLRIGIQWKMMLVPLGIVAVFLALILGYISPQIQDSLMLEKKNSLKNSVQAAMSIINNYYQQELEGNLPRGAAQIMAMTQIRNLRYGGGSQDYFWITDYKPVMILEVSRPELEKQDLTEFKDPDGKAIYVEMVKLAQTEGKAYYSYKWSTDEQSRNFQPKLAYIEAFQPWEWVIGTGDFTTGVIVQMNADRDRYLLLGGAVALICILAVFFFSRSISSNIRKVARAADQLATGNTEIELKVKSRDETGDMSDSLSKVVRYLKEMSVAAERIAAGDLTVQVTPKSNKDSLGLAFEKMVINLHQMVKKVQDNANALASASTQLANASEQSGSATNQIAAVSQQIARGSEEQTRGIGEVKHAIDELSKAIDIVAQGSQEQVKAVEQATGIVQQVSSAAEQTASSAQEAAHQATQATDVAKRGSATVEKTIEGMSKINATMQDVAKKIAQLGKFSEEIGGMISVIDDIAAQTNLLALNAAIEAARAGEQGRGFAVVADEVKKLAERTAKETKEIAALVSSVQKGVAESINASMEGAKQAEDGSRLANEAGIALAQIMNAIDSMTAQVEQISAAAQEMSSSATQMVKVIDGVSKVAEQNAAATRQMTSSKLQVSDSASTVAATIEENSAAAEEMSASAEEMSAQVQQVVASSQSLSNMARELQQLTSRFYLGGRGVATNRRENSKPEEAKVA